MVAGILVVAFDWPIPRIKYADAAATTTNNPIPSPISHLGIPLWDSVGRFGTSGFTPIVGTTKFSAGVVDAGSCWLLDIR